MRKIVVTEFVSLDGVAESPEKWSATFWNDDISKFKHEELFAMDALLLGRVTYEGFAAAWPARTGDPYSDRMNSVPKYVASKTLTAATWNNARLLNGDVAEAVARLKQEPGQDVLVFGSLTLASALAQHRLVDEYRLLVYPVVLGGGKRLFKDGHEGTLALAEARPVGADVALLRYLPR